MKLIFELSKSGRVCSQPPVTENIVNDAVKYLPFTRQSALELPEVAEVDLARHYTNLSRASFGVDNGFYPLGSCTMKYNPKVNEDAASLSGFTNSHPLQSSLSAHGSLEVLYTTQEYLKELTGMDAVTLQPAAGAHGELTGIMMIKKYHESRNHTKRTKIIVPDSAHGTNPATANVCGYDVVEIASRDDGRVDIDKLKEVLSDEIAGIMLTNPNTLGLYEKDILEIAKLVHEVGGLLYYDGANFNAIMGIVRPGEMGFDVVHLNLHKSFSTPHGGGGPGSGPVGVKKFLEPFLPKPVVVKNNDKYLIDNDRPSSIGKVRSFYGNFAIVVRALTYMLSLGCDGMYEVGEVAVLNANYIKSKLKDYFKMSHNGFCMHEFVISCADFAETYGIHATDFAKSLIDNGYHPPTMYFPLIVKEALMVEPTETESKETLDLFAEAMIALAYKAKTEAEEMHNSPVTTLISRPDDVTAARKPILKYE